MTAFHLVRLWTLSLLTQLRRRLLAVTSMSFKDGKGKEEADENAVRPASGLQSLFGAKSPDADATSAKPSIQAAAAIEATVVRPGNAAITGPSGSTEAVDEEEDTHWKVVINDSQFSKARHYATNGISTGKYSLVTFLPMNIFEQFSRVANLYFLILLILQLIPAISSLSPVTTALPLFLVLGISAVKDGYDDFQRHRSDREVNNRLATVITADCPNGEIPWKSVCVGSILRLENNDFVAADILLLKSSEPNGLCFVETAELDGETNLKVRQSVDGVAGCSNLTTLDGVIRCERPNNVLDKFDGALHWKKETFALDNSNLLLRGCKLRNTKFVYGVVIFAGHETKLMQNSGKAHFKRTKLDKLMNYLLLWIFAFLVSLSIFGAVGSSIWERLVGKSFLLYIPYVETGVDTPEVVGTLQFFSYLILLNALVPISLYVSVEFIRMGQSFLINWDRSMYHEPTDTPAKARTSTLNEELGQIEYIFSDKTGTLTQNHMRFMKCSIDGMIYGCSKEEEEEVEEVGTVGHSESMTTATSFLDDMLSSPMNRAVACGVPAEPIIDEQADSQDVFTGDTGADSGVGTHCSSGAEFRDMAPIALPGQAEIPDGDEEEADSRRLSSPSVPDSAISHCSDIIFSADSPDSRSPTLMNSKRHSNLPLAVSRIDDAASRRSSSPSPGFSPKHTPESRHDRKASVQALFTRTRHDKGLTPPSSIVSQMTSPSMSKRDSGVTITNNALLDAEGLKGGKKRLDFTLLSPYGEASFEFYDASLVTNTRDQTCLAFEFFHALALCHTVMSEQDSDELVYQAQSPDEAALVSAARNFGIAFVSRTSNTITLNVHGELREYQLLCILDFDNVRKRMSVIVRCPDGRLMLYCKGADNVVFDRCQHTVTLESTTSDHLGMFASDGLRTLCIASKQLDEVEFGVWRTLHHEANISLEDRHQKLDMVYEEIEQDMDLIGASAIEDKLQDRVPEAIANLVKGNMKIWVLTGDKEETAINIGYACRLLTAQTNVYVVEGSTFGEVKTSLRRIQDLIAAERRRFTAETGIVLSDNEDPFEDPNKNIFKPRFGLVINGHSLSKALTEQMEMLFLETACLCAAVICCRVTPLQKATVVELVKVHKNAITLAIGDGANDVGMIKAAHIGVGISGKEGLQAVLASDYSFAQFHYLERLLLVHGRWSYMRMSKFLSYFFYKNFAFMLVQFWFAFFCGFTAQTSYDPWFIAVYNLIFTSLPVILLGVVDQDVCVTLCLRYPRLYIPGQQNLLFNRNVFFSSLSRGIYVSLVVYFVAHFAYGEMTNADGKPLDSLYVFGGAAAGLLVFVVNVQVALDTYHWTFLNFAVLILSVASWFVFVAVLYAPQGIYARFPTLFYDIGVHTQLFSTATFWFTLLLASVMACLPVIGVRFYRAMTNPLLVDLLRSGYVPEELEEPAAVPHSPPTAVTMPRSVAAMATGRSPSPVRRHRQLASVSSNLTTATNATGYAFSHMYGFGELITSGRAFIGNLVSAIPTPRLPRLSIAASLGGSPKAPDLASSASSSVAVQACSVAVNIAAPVPQRVLVSGAVASSGPSELSAASTSGRARTFSQRSV